MKGEPGCHNEVDLEGSYVLEKVAFVLRDDTDLESRCRTIAPRLVIYGTLGDSQETVPPCPPCSMDSGVISIFPWTMSMLVLLSIPIILVFQSAV